MGFAPHTNEDVRVLLRGGKSKLPLVLGCFREKEHGQLFEYSERKWHCEEMNPEFQHCIYLQDGNKRLAKVLKTRVHVLVDEGVVETWEIKQHRKYETEWVFAT